MNNRNLLFSLFATFMMIVASVNAQEQGLSYLQKALVNQYTGEVNPMDVQKASNDLARISTGKYQGTDWLSVGAADLAGRLNAVIIDNKDATGNTIYLAGDRAGIWKSSNLGLSWDKVNDDTQSLFVTSMAQAENGDIYVSTGNKKNYYVGSGIYKSTDGIKFNVLESTIPALSDIDNNQWAFVSKIILGNSGQIYAATQHGLMISADNGQSWAKASANGTKIDGECLSIEVSHDKTTVYAFIGGKSYISTSGATGFESITGEDLMPETALLVKFATTATDPNVVYAIAINKDGVLINVYRSDDKGKKWDVVGAGGSSLYFNPFADPSLPKTKGIGLEYCEIAISNTSVDTIFIGGSSIFMGAKPVDGQGHYYFNSIFANNFYAPSKPSSFYFDSHSRLWIPFVRGLGAYDCADPSNSKFFQKIGISHFNSVSLGKDDKVTAGEDSYGVCSFRFEGNAETTTFLFGTPRGSGALVERSSINRDFIINSTKAETNKRDAIKRSVDNGETYAQKFISDNIAKSETNTDMLPFTLWESFDEMATSSYISYKNVSKKVKPAGTTIWAKSKVGGYPIPYVLTADLAVNDSVTVLDKLCSRFFIACEKDNKVAELWMCPEVQDVTSEPIWYRIAELEGEKVAPTAITVSNDGQHVFVGVDKGIVYRVSNVLAAKDSLTATVGASEYALTSNAIFTEADRMVTSIAVDPNNSNHVVITLGNYGNDKFIYETKNALDPEPTFTSIQLNLPKAPAYCALIEKDNSEMIFVGTEWGLFYLEGNTWKNDSKHMGIVPVTAIRQQTKEMASQTVVVGVNENLEDVYGTLDGIYNTGTIYVATFGRGVWKSKNSLSAPIIPISNNKDNNRLDIYPNPAQNTVRVNLENVQDGKVDIRILDLNGRIVYLKAMDVQDQMLSIDLQNVSEGSYILQVIEAGRVRSGKLLIVK